MNIEVSSVVIANKSIEFSANKNGEGMKLVTQKRLGELTGLKGAALKRAHFNYRIEAGKALNAGLSSGMAAGEIIAKSVIPTKSGGLRAVFDRTENLSAPAPRRNADAEISKLQLEIESLRLQLASR